MELTADCARCAGLCCVALPFRRSADFAIDKPAGRPCPNLGDEFGCGIHDRLRPSGFRGCVAFDCLGAGQQVVQVTFGGRDWRSAPELREPMFAAFAMMQLLHQLMWFVEDALARPVEASRPELLRLRERVETAAALPGDDLSRFDVATLQRDAAGVLREVSSSVRAGRGDELADADLAGADLRRRDLRAANLRNATLIGADLRGVDLSDADLIGADLRDTDLRGADLARALFVTPMQLGAARVDGATRMLGPRRPPGAPRARPE